MTEQRESFHPTTKTNLWVSEKSNEDFSMSFRVKDVLFSQKSKFQKVEIVDTYGYGRMLLNDGLVMTCEADEFIYHEALAHIPMLLSKNVRKVLVIGGGDGGTVREVLKHSSVEKCVMVEIDEVVTRACQEFLPQTASQLTDPRVELVFEDGVKYVAETQETFDLILVDSSDPIGPATPLFNEEFYKQIKRCLRTQGFVASQAESPFIYTAMQDVLVRILKAQFQQVDLFNFTNMTYPGGLWSFSLASDNPHFDLSNAFDLKAFQKIEPKLRYLTKDLLAGSFALPKFQKERLSKI